MNETSCILKNDIKRRFRYYDDIIVFIPRTNIATFL
jgi:hypothetical protein